MRATLAYGYQLQPDETAGPMGSTGGIIVLLLWPVGFVLLLLYGLVLLSYGIFRFFRWLGEAFQGNRTSTLSEGAGMMG